MNNPRLWLFIAVFLIASCGREFSAPLPAPQVATSRFSDTLYLADPMANMIRLIDRNSGIQTDQFPIFDELAFGAVEVACLVDRTGIQPTVVGELPEQLAALNRTNVNTQLLTIEAALTRRKDKIYQAAMLDPHTAAELPLDRIRAMCDDLIAAHGDYLPRYR